MSKPPAQLHIFQDALICGVIGGVVAFLLGAPGTTWAMLCAIAGPLSIYFATLALEKFFANLPYRESGVYEFALFALATAVAVRLSQFMG